MDVAAGFFCHTGWATAIVLGGDPGAPTGVLRTRVELHDPALHPVGAPYHAAAGLPDDEAARVVREATEAIRKSVAAAFEDLVADAGAHRLVAAGVVLATDVPASAMRHPQARKHLGDVDVYRDALTSAARDRGLPVARVVESKLTDAVGLPLDVLRDVLHAAGIALGRPWRAEERSAALAAWVALRAVA